MALPIKPDKTAKQDTLDKHAQIELLQAISAHKDRDAFVAFFKFYGPRLKSFLMQGGFDNALAEELVQETMISVWQRAESYNSTKSSPSTWIYTIARNKKIDHLRKYKHPEHAAEDLDFSIQSDPDADIFRKEVREDIKEAIATLPKEQSDLILKAFYEDKPHSEIAEETGIPLGTVKSRLRLAIQKMRQIINTEHIELES